MPNQKTVLIITDTLSFHSGVASVIMNYLRHFDFSRFSCHVAVSKTGDKALEQEAIRLGVTIHPIPDPGKGAFFAYRKKMRRLLAAHSFDVIHGHVANSAFLYLPLAKKAGIRHRIVHSHNSKGADSPLKALRNRLICLPITRQANHFFACSKEAGAYLFGQTIASTRLELIPNAIDTARFAFDPVIRRHKRADWGIGEDTIAIGHVGRFAPQKNHAFLLQAFALFAQKTPNSVLILAGEGPLRPQMEALAGTLGLSQSVHFLGKVSDMAAVYQGLDQFWMPSFFEGLPVSGLEAQCAGLTCIFSDTIPDEVKVTDPVEFLPIQSGDDLLWAQAAQKALPLADRSGAAHQIKQSIYDIEKQGKHLADLYENIVGLEEY